MENTFYNAHLTALPQTNHITLSSGHSHFGGPDLHFIMEFFKEMKMKREFLVNIVNFVETFQHLNLWFRLNPRYGFTTLKKSLILL